MTDTTEPANPLDTARDRGGLAEDGALTGAIDDAAAGATESETEGAATPMQGGRAEEESEGHPS